MVRAILGGSKTQTRRVMKPQPEGFWGSGAPPLHGGVLQCIVTKAKSPGLPPVVADEYVRCPYGVRGDRLWVRETWCNISYEEEETKACVLYRADGDLKPPEVDWRPSIFMPRWASRITLKITDIRVQRLQEISEEDAKAEGAMFHDGRGIGHSGWRHDIDHGFVYATAKSSFMKLWDAINAKRGLGSDKNPWVWAVAFTRLLEARS